jgi:HTH-type transcriptional regulator/antitoxin HipB
MGPELKSLRNAKGWSQQELGRRIGLSQERIAAIENHPERVALDQILSLLMALDAEIQIAYRSEPDKNVGETTQDNW